MLVWGATSSPKAIETMGDFQRVSWIQITWRRQRKAEINLIKIGIQAMFVYAYVRVEHYKKVCFRANIRLAYSTFRIQRNLPKIQSKFWCISFYNSCNRRFLYNTFKLHKSICLINPVHLTPIMAYIMTFYVIWYM